MALLTTGLVRTRGIRLLLALMHILSAVSHGTDDSRLAAADIAADPARCIMASGRVPPGIHDEELGGPCVINMLVGCTSCSIRVSPDLCGGLMRACPLCHARHLVARVTLALRVLACPSMVCMLSKEPTPVTWTWGIRL